MNFPSSNRAYADGNNQSVIARNLVDGKSQGSPLSRTARGNSANKYYAAAGRSTARGLAHDQIDFPRMGTLAEVRQKLLAKIAAGFRPTVILGSDTLERPLRTQLDLLVARGSITSEQAKLVRVVLQVQKPAPVPTKTVVAEDPLARDVTDMAAFVRGEDAVSPPQEPEQKPTVKEIVDVPEVDEIEDTDDEDTDDEDTDDTDDKA